MERYCRIDLLGGLRVSQGDRVITRFRAQKYGALLAYLAYHLRTHPREVLIEILWPELDLDAGRNNLRVAVASLRRQLEPPGGPAGRVIVADRLYVGLNPAAVTTDVEQFETALQLAGRAPGPAQQAQHLAEAAALYQGPLLPGFYEEWVLPEQGRLAERYYGALRQLIACREAAGELREALELAYQAIQVDPAREEAHRELMRLFLEDGQPAQAARQYRRLEQILSDELGSEPGAESRALAARARREATGGAAGSPGAGTGPGPAPRPAAGPRFGPGSGHFPAITPPAGTVTLLRLDWGGETATAPPPRRLRHLVHEHGGWEAEGSRSVRLAVFASAGEAIAAAVAIQRSLHGTGRIAIHTGDVEFEKGRYRGASLPIVARLLEASHPGQILCSEATVSVVGPGPAPAPEWIDLGSFRLRGAGPEGSPQLRLYQLAYRGMPTTALQRPRAETAHASSLPWSLTPFIGRDAEVAQLLALLAPQARERGAVTSVARGGAAAPGPDAPRDATCALPAAPRLITLSGVGGTGKTRLALEVAGRQAAGARPVWFVPLAGLSDPRTVAGAIADAMGLPRSPVLSPFEQVVQTLIHQSRSGQPPLLVLDNLEHLLSTSDCPDILDPSDRSGRSAIPDPESALEVVRRLLEQVPPLTCLVTSRQTLGLRGEHEFRVRTMATPAAEAPGSPEELLQCESVRLFVERAQAALPDFQLTERNAPAVAGLCARLEGIPLAIELAAARARALTPAQMQAQIATRFDFLVGRSQGDGDRHRSLRSALDWSYRLLDPGLQRFFIRISAFRGGVTADLAAAVSGATPASALDTLTELRDCSLLIAELHDAGSRFRMLDTVREYAWAQLVPDEQRAVCGRHALACLALAEEADRQLAGADQAAWLTRLEAEHDNLRVALEWCLTGEGSGEAAGPGMRAATNQPPGYEVALRLAASLARFWLVRNHRQEARRWLDLALRSAEGRARNPEWTVRALRGAGWLAWGERDGVRARAMAEAALALCGSRTEPWSRWEAAFALTTRGLAAYLQGDHELEADSLAEALPLAEGTGDRWLTAHCRYQRGLMDHEHRRTESAHQHLAAAVDDFRAAGDRWNLACALRSLGHLLQGAGDYAGAAAMLEEALQLFRDLGDEWGIAMTVGTLGHLARFQDDNVTARARYQEALTLQRERVMGDRCGVAHSLHNLGHVARSLGEHELARAHYRESLAIFRELDYGGDLAFSLEGFSGLAAAEGDFERCARLRGAADGLRERARIPLAAIDRAQYNHYLEEARTALGERAFAAALAAGGALSPAEAVAEALDEPAR